MQNYLDQKLRENGLFQTRFEDGGYVVWRPLPWSDYRRYREARGIIGPSIDVQIEDSVYKRCVVFSTYDTPPPESLTEEESEQWLHDCRMDQPAGVVPTVVKSIMYMSGAMSGKAIIAQLDQHRPLAANIEDQMVALVCRAFPSYTPEQVEALPWHVLLKRVAQAEMLLGTPIELIDHEAEEKKAIAAQKLDLQREIRDVTEGMRRIDGGDPRQAAKDAHEASRERSEHMRQLREQYFNRRGA